MLSKRVPLIILAFFGVLIAAFLVARVVVTDAPSEAQSAKGERLDTRLAALATQQAGDGETSRFSGVLLGIAIAPSQRDLPDSYRRQQEASVIGGCAEQRQADPGSLQFSGPLVLPPKFLPAGQLAETGRPATVVCGGAVTVRTWQYAATNDDATPADVYISRTTYTGYDFDASADRVSPTKIAGRDAILVRPVTPDGLAQRAMVVFPEAFGSTSIQTFNVAEAELLTLAESVAAASK